MWKWSKAVLYAMTKQGIRFSLSRFLTLNAYCYKDRALLLPGELLFSHHQFFFRLCLLSLIPSPPQLSFSEFLKSTDVQMSLRLCTARLWSRRWMVRGLRVPLAEKKTQPSPPSMFSWMVITGRSGLRVLPSSRYNLNSQQMIQIFFNTSNFFQLSLNKVVILLSEQQQQQQQESISSSDLNTL